MLSSISPLFASVNGSWYIMILSLAKLLRFTVIYRILVLASILKKLVRYIFQKISIVKIEINEIIFIAIALVIAQGFYRLISLIFWLIKNRKE